ncbi:hypothetical protein GYMLUDRAFT_231614 [Collybiopsis luxurians FD-317 M1]|uniref:Vacuolar protein-sorting-associated protein 36 n=1 Tax=Collybiopsis luxurians FD-317 M1 TaxID=944289 RepID=A0A0D0CIA3_9AGAR|nr:hypothetical protein GYMLUDRAFT_231614 [Collybiopsis luxurians FD-317 M1]
MALARFTKPVDGTIPVQALLYADEELLSSQDAVGIYDGLQKSPEHQVGIVHVTTQRLLYIDASRKARSRSFALDLAHVSRTDHYAGLFTSSPKVTLHLSADDSSVGGGGVERSDRETGVESGFETWECEVCAFRNPPGLSPSASRICGLCGVPRSSAPTNIQPSSSTVGTTSSSLASSVSTSALPTPRNRESIACPACTFLNHPSMKKCEICDTPLPRIAPAVSASSAENGTTKSAPATRPATPGIDEGAMMIKLSFRKGGDKPFYTALKRSLKGQAWEINNPLNRLLPNANANDTGAGVRSGISGIMHAVETRAQTRDTHMSDALQDLEALMVKAKDMVRLAAELNERLTVATAATSTAAPTAASASASEPEEATFIRSSLTQLGLQMENTPVTLDMMKDERRWIEELARELAGVLQGSPGSGSGSGGGLMSHRGLIALDEVWGGWNRARGVALVPPSTLLLVVPHLPAYTDPPIKSLVLPSEMRALHTPEYEPKVFGERVVRRMRLKSTTTTEIAQREGVGIALAEEMVSLIEREGGLSRDDGRYGDSDSVGFGGGEVRWWANVFVGYIWDGQA